MSNKKFGSGAAGKGYYIALILCAVAIGISGYLYYSSTVNEDAPDASDVNVAATGESGGHDLEVVATQPTYEPGGSTDASQEPTATTGVTRKKLQTVSPVEGEIVAVYAMDSLGYNATTRDWRTHNGMDIAAQEGAQVCAAADGTVYTVYSDEAMGMTVVIRHEDGYMTSYSSLAEEVSVQPGDTVTRGQAIGCVGDTALLESAIGCHVHFSVSCNDEPVDPAQFLAQE